MLGRRSQVLAVNNYPARRNYIPHIRYWSPGLIAIRAKSRIDLYLVSSGRTDAQVMVDG